MARTLGAEISAAQESQSRHSLVELVSSQMVADIPFDGQFLADQSYDERGPAFIAHSSGRLAGAFIYGPAAASADGITYFFTDENRTEFSFVNIPLYNADPNPILSVSLCELTGGNIGLVYLVNYGGYYRLIRRIVTVTGTAVSNAEIASWANTIFTSHPWVRTLGENSYIIVYGKFDDPNYYIYKRTSADFATWSAEAALSIGGLTSTWKLRNPSLMTISTGQLWLWFDVLEDTGENGEELTNVYYSTSDDNGSTWANAVKVTNYDTFAEVAAHPVAIQKVADQMHLLYNTVMSRLNMNGTSTGWLRGDTPSHIHFDSVNRVIYVVNGGAYWSVIKIDVDTWSILNAWDYTTVPAIDDYFNNKALDLRFWQGDGHLAIFGLTSSSANGVFQVLDGEAETITTYSVKNIPAEGITANINNAPSQNLLAGQIDIAGNKIWLCFCSASGYPIGQAHTFSIGYLDLSDTGPDYDYHAVVSDYPIAYFGADLETFRVYPDADLIIVAGTFQDLGTNYGRTVLFNISSGALYKSYRYSETYPSCPRRGLRGPIYYDGRLYGGVTYESGYGQADYRGMCIVDLATDSFIYSRPGYASIDNYGFVHFTVDQANGKLYASSDLNENGGTSVYEIASGLWTLYNNDSIPGYSSYYNNTYMTAFDPTSGMIFAAISQDGVTGFSEYGYLRQASYRIGTWTGAAWSWGDESPLVQGFADFDAVAALDPDLAGSMYVFWVNEDMLAGDDSIKWDKDGSSFEVSDYLLTGKEVVLERSIDGSPAKLTFALSHGYLFDPYNIASLYSMYLRKGRRITLRWGEEISGTPYWENGGIFVVTATQTDYQRGVYSGIDVECEDPRVIWGDHQILATEYYQAMPKALLEDLLQTHANAPAGDIEMPVFENSVLLERQWIETSIAEIYNRVCNRFGYYARTTADGKYSARKISDSNPVDHAYSNTMKIIRYSPDDRYSDFTNRVIVVGQERNFIEVLFAEEKVGAVQGTCGWWGYRNDFDVSYSEDRSRRCRNPRLVVLESATSIGFRLAGSIEERISYVDPNEKYCTITVSAPNLTPLLATLLMGEFAALFYNPDAVQVGPSGFGWTINFGTLLRSTLLFLILMILSSIGNFQYEIYAQPVGKIRRSVQGEAYDIEHQTEVGTVVTKKFEDELCYSATECAFVANYELMIAKLQRKRITIEKVAHLQDEDGDTIEVPHPYTGQTVRLFVVNLRRRFKKAVPGGMGYFLDEIEGWKVG